MKKRTIFVGDVHGCLTELRSLLALLSFSPPSDELVLLGDLVDRGPSPVETVRFVRSELVPAGARVIQGNHEDKLGRWRLRERQFAETGRKNMMHPPSDERRAQWLAFSDEEVAWMTGLPYVYRPPEGSPARGWIAGPAGFLPGAPVDRQAPGDMMRIRHVHKDSGKMLALGDDFKDPPDGVVWTERWTGPESVVYGHFVRSLGDPVVEERAPGVLCVGLDTGCCFGGRLTAMVLRPGAAPEYASVPAGAQYCKLGGGRF